MSTVAERPAVVESTPVDEQTELTTIERLDYPMPADGPMSWIITAFITLLALLIRLVDLRRPTKLIFDETYYAKDAYSLVTKGYEIEWAKNAKDQIDRGIMPEMGDAPSFVVHPPLGKEIIGLGERLFGFNSFGWRIMACIFGALLIAVVIRMTRRLTRSTMIGALAGFLLTVDGLHYVMSRIALLDIFQAFFVAAGIACMVADRDYFRHQLATYLRLKNLTDLGGKFGPLVLWRPWRLAAGILFGLGIAVKWNSLFPLAAMCLLTLAWDISARRLAGASARSLFALIGDGVPAFFWQVVVAAMVYTATWWRWFTTWHDTTNSVGELKRYAGWGRTFGWEHPDDPLVKAYGSAIGSWIKYHQDIYAFHTGEFIRNATHPYDAHPAGWLVMARTIGIDSQNDIKPGTQGCPAGGDSCLRVIAGMGTPLLWWFGVGALLVGLVWWVLGRDWRFSVPIVALASTWLPWWQSADRPVFFFYAIMIIPFTCMAVAMVLGKILGPAQATDRRRRGAVVVGAIVAAITANFAFILPVLNDTLMPRWQWLARMWLASWI